MTIRQEPEPGPGYHQLWLKWQLSLMVVGGLLGCALGIVTIGRPLKSKGAGGTLGAIGGAYAGWKIAPRPKEE